MTGAVAPGLRSSTEPATTPAGSTAAIAAFVGDLDLATIESFEAAVSEAGDAGLVIDLSGVRFIDSSGIHCVVRARMARADRDLAVELVVAADSAVERVLEMSGLSEELGAKPDRNAALAALDGSPANGAGP